MSTTHLNHRDATRLAERIVARRCELDLTPGEAARRACVSTSTWTKYETSGRIGEAKVAGVCRALQWADLTGVPAPYRDQPDRPGWSLAIALARKLDSCGIGTADVLVRRLFDHRDRLRHADDEHGPHLCWQCVIEVERRHLERNQAHLSENFAKWDANRETEPFTEDTERMPF